MITNIKSLPATGIDPMVGEEVIRVSLESLGLHIQLTSSQVQIISNLLIIDQGVSIGEIIPNKRSGPVVLLWSLVGQTIISIDWGNTLSIVFSNGLMIRMLPSLSGRRGTIWGGSKDRIEVEDF